MASESGQQQLDNLSLASNSMDYFVQGKITAVQGQELLVDDEQRIVNRIIITDQTRFWKGRVGAPLSEVKVGDFFYARGVLAGNVLTGSRVWVNIVSIPGVVTRVENGRLSLDTGKEEL